jgi:large subunit ribosomal protein L9
MEVILKEDFPQLGYVGDKIDVKRGYARNFLFPRGIAVEAHSKNAKLLKHKLSAVVAKKLKLQKIASEEAKKVEGLILEFKVPASKQGKIFGSITLKDIETSLKDKGVVVDRRQIKIPDSIKVLGEHAVSIKFHSEVFGKFTVRVVAKDKDVAPPKEEEN